MYDNVILRLMCDIYVHVFAIVIWERSMIDYSSQTLYQG